MTSLAKALAATPNRPVRLQLSRAKDFSLQSLSLTTNGREAVKIDRGTDFGNPYVVGGPLDMAIARRWGWKTRSRIVCETPLEAVRRFTHDLLWDEAVHARVRKKLGEKNLACWCAAGATCHGDTLLFVANSTPNQIRSVHAMIDDRIFTASEALLEGVRL